MNPAKPLTEFAGPAALMISAGAQAHQKNILFIAVDDLKPVTGAYSDKNAKTPGMDRLAPDKLFLECLYRE